MSFDAVDKITKAEEASRETISEAEAKARQMIIDAETNGKNSIDLAILKARSERESLLKDIDKKISDNTKSSNDKIKEKVGSLRNEASSKIDNAAALIVERILNA